MHIIVLFLATISSVHGQIQLSELTTNGNGSEAYFRSVLPLKSEAAEPAVVPGRILRVGPGGFELYLERTSAYFNLIRVTKSRDGRTVAVVGRRECPGVACSNYFQTTISGLPSGNFEVEGEGTLSGNGRYLLVFKDGLPRRCWFVVDLENPGGSPCTLPASGDGRTAGRAIADNGTAIVSDGALEFLHGTETSRVLRSGSPKEAVIDAAAKIVVYSVSESGRRSIRAYRIADQHDYELVSVRGADSYGPLLSADASRVMFLSTASGTSQIHVVATSGDEPQRQVTHEESGVVSAAMSDDGKVAWYFSGSGRLYWLDLETGETKEHIGRTLQIGTAPPGVAGSLYTVPGVGFTDVIHRASGFPLPRTLGGVSVTVNGVDAPLVSVSPTKIVMQMPSASFSTPSLRINTGDQSPFRPATTFTAQTGGPSFFHNQQRETLAVHEDWSELVTEANPAQPDEVIHLYGTGFGTVERPPADGNPAPANPPSRTYIPVTCSAIGADNLTRLTIPILYSGLAPGLAGVYQLDMRLPVFNLRAAFSFACIGEGNSIDFYGAFAVRP